ncbi:MAG: SDR family NAD(P)-dependent oxidoreductase [Nitrososphaerales archaeon]
MTPKSTPRIGGRLEGEVALIAGGSGGIGEATAIRFAKEGAKVAVHYSGKTSASKKRALEVVGKLRELGCKAISVKADFSNYPDVKRAVDSVVREWGKITLAVCYAGLPSTIELWQEDPLQLSDAELLSAVNVDFLGSYHFMKALIGHMKKPRHGKIVLISSTPAIQGEEGGYRFTLAKGLNRLSVKSLAAKLAKDYGVHLNAIALGTIETSANRRNYTVDQWKELVSGIPMGRAGKPDDIAGAALFLCSHDSDYVVGQTLVVDGGEVRL